MAPAEYAFPGQACVAKMEPQLPQVRSMSEIASDLCRSSTSLHSSSAASAGGEEGISRSNSAHSLTTAGGNFCTINSNHSASQLSSEESEATREAQRDMYAALKARQSALEEALRKKTEQLKAICLKEAELTGVLPLEMPLVDGDPVPQVRKRVGTAFSLSSALLNRTDPQEEEDLLAAVELDYEIQDKIVKAAHKLALDPTVARNVRKQRRTSYQRAHTKLKDLEKKVNDHRQHAGIVPVHAAGSVEGTTCNNDSPFSPDPASSKSGNFFSESASNLRRLAGSLGRRKSVSRSKSRNDLLSISQNPLPTPNLLLRRRSYGSLQNCIVQDSCQIEGQVKDILDKEAVAPPPKQEISVQYTIKSKIKVDKDYLGRTFMTDRSCPRLKGSRHDFS